MFGGYILTRFCVRVLLYISIINVVTLNPVQFYLMRYQRGTLRTKELPLRSSQEQVGIEYPSESSKEVMIIGREVGDTASRQS